MFNRNTPSSIGRGMFAITPHASNSLPQTAFGIYVGGTSGNLVGTTLEGDVITVPVFQGMTLAVAFVKVHTDSTATLLFGMRL